MELLVLVVIGLVGLVLVSGPLALAMVLGLLLVQGHEGRARRNTEARLAALARDVAALKAALAEAPGAAEAAEAAEAADVPQAESPGEEVEPARPVERGAGPERPVERPEAHEPPGAATDRPGGPEPGPPEPDAPEPPPAAEGPPPSPPPPSAPRPPPALPQLPSIEQVVAWVAALLGALALLLAGLFALVAAFQRGWIDPATRIAAGLALGTAVWVAGEALRGRARLPASALAGAGMGTLYGVLYAAHGLYGLLPSSAAFALMVAVTLVGMAGAVRHRDRFLAHLAVLGGLLTPILVSTGDNAPVPLFVYLALVGAGAAIAARRGFFDVLAHWSLGAAAIHLGWTITWYAADQVPFGLLGALLLALPPLAAASPKAWAPVGVTAAAGACLAALLALPWVVPVDPLFTDPRTGLAMARPFGLATTFSLLALLVLPLPAWLAGRRLRSMTAGLAATTAACTLALVGVFGHLVLDAPPLALLVGVLVGLLAVGTVVNLGVKHLPWASFPLPAVVGLLLALALGVADPPAGLSATAVLGVLLLGAAPTRLGAPVAALLSTLVGVAAPLLVLGLRVDTVGASEVVGPALVSLVVLSHLPLLLRWAHHPQVAWITAALASLLLFPPLYLAWEARLGEAALGLLPVLLGLNALLLALVLVRRHRVHRGDASLALLGAVALFGLTAALPIQLQERWLTVAWGLEAAALAWLALRLHHPLLRLTSVLLGVTVAARLLLNPFALAYGDASGWPVLNWTLYTWGLPLICLLLASVWLGRAHRLRPLPGAGALEVLGPPLLWTLAVLVGFALVNVQVSHAFQDAGPIALGGHGLLQGMVRSLAWAAYGTVVLVIGSWRDRRVVRLYGFGFVLLAASKVFLLDLWQLSGFIRVGSVLGLGLSLLLAALLFERLVLRDAGTRRAKETS